MLHNTYNNSTEAWFSSNMYPSHDLTSESFHFQHCTQSAILVLTGMHNMAKCAVKNFALKPRTHLEYMTNHSDIGHSKE